MQLLLPTILCGRGIPICGEVSWRKSQPFAVTPLLYFLCHRPAVPAKVFILCYFLSCVYTNERAATLKWVRGELIGQGTYGKVYLALNSTNGEMIAVKQVELPRTASDKNDTRQHTVVQALKMEGEILKDLNHPNIVQYLGFEETPSNFSM